MNWIKKSAIRLGLSLARAYVTPDAIKEEARKAMTEIAAKAHSGDRTRAILERAKNVCAAMEDGVVSVEETELIIGDVVTRANIDRLFSYVERKVG